MLFVDAYLMTGRLSHANQLMGYHVQYLYWFLQLEGHILRADGPLTHDLRYYIGIMVSYGIKRLCPLVCNLHRSYKGPSEECSKSRFH